MATESSGLTPNDFVESASGKTGIKITTNNEILVNSITIDTTQTPAATICYILNSSKSIVATSGTVSGGVGTFSTPYLMADATDYFLAVDNGGSSYDVTFDNTASSYYTKSGTNWDWIAGLNHNGSVNAIDDWTFSIISADVGAEPSPSPDSGVGTGSSGTRFIATRYPVEDGLVAGTTSQIGHISNLVAENSIVPERKTTGVR